MSSYEAPAGKAPAGKAPAGRAAAEKAPAGKAPAGTASGTNSSKVEEAARTHHELYEDRLNELVQPTVACTIVCGEIKIAANRSILEKSTVIRKAFSGGFKESHVLEYEFNGRLDHLLVLVFYLYTCRYPDSEDVWRPFVERFPEEAIRKCTLRSGDLSFHLAMFNLAQYHDLLSLQTSSYECCLLLLATQGTTLREARARRQNNIFSLAFNDGTLDATDLSDERLAADIQKITTDEVFVDLIPIQTLLVHLFESRRSWPPALRRLPQCVVQAIEPLATKVIAGTIQDVEQVCMDCGGTVEEVQFPLEDKEMGKISTWVAPKHCSSCLTLVS